jgi:hypothetical protein
VLEPDDDVPVFDRLDAGERFVQPDRAELRASTTLGRDFDEIVRSARFRHERSVRRNLK